MTFGERAREVLEILTTLMLALHLFAVNVGAAGPLACIWLHRLEHRNKNVTAGYLGRRLAGLSMLLLAVGLLLGLLLLGLLWLAEDRAYFSAAAQIPMTRYWFALAELAFAFGCLAAYLLLWDRLGQRRFWHGLIAVVASTNLLFHFPPLLTMIAVISTRPELEGLLIDSPTYRQLLLDSEIASRVVHVWLASLAVTGLLVTVCAEKVARRVENPADAIRLATWGARWALLPTLGQLGVGLWVTLALKDEARVAVMGADALATSLLGISIFMSLVLLHHLAALAMGEISRPVIWRSVLLLALVLVLMSGTLRRVRAVSAREVAGHWSIDRESTRLVAHEEPTDVKRRDPTE